MSSKKIVALVLLTFAGNVGLAAEEQAELQAADEETMTQAAAQYQALLAQPPDKLAEIGRERAIQLLADLQYGRAIARIEARERNLEHTRVELMSLFDEAKQAHADLGVAVEAEMERIRQQFAESPAECDRQLLNLIARHRPRVLQLQAEATRYEESAQATDQRLATVRQQLLAVRAERDLLAQGHKFQRSAMPHLLVQLVQGDETQASLGIDEQTIKELDLDPALLGSGTEVTDQEVDRDIPEPPITRETVEQAVQQFRDLF